MTVKDTDHGYADLVRRMHALAKGARVSAGIHAQDGNHSHGGALTVLDVATFHEFGTSRVPMRSFVRGWMTIHEKDVHALYLDQLRLYLTGKATPAQVLNRIGLYMSGGMKQRISARIPPPLAAVTIRKKGSSVPLVDTGQLRASITYSFRWAGGQAKYVPSEAQAAYKEAARKLRKAHAKAVTAARKARVKAVKKALKGTKRGIFRAFKASKKTVTKGLRRLRRLTK